MSEAAPIPLTADHVQAVAAWLAHGPGTVRQVAVKADVALTLLHPRTDDLLAVGGLRVVGQSDTEGPIISAATGDVHTPSTTDVVERKLNSLPVRDQVSIAAGIMARHGKRGRRTSPFGTQAELL